MMKKEDQDKYFPYCYICADCARAKGGEWPKELYATSHKDICPYCEKQKSLCATTDWNYPKLKIKHVWD